MSFRLAATALSLAFGIVLAAFALLGSRAPAVADPSKAFSPDQKQAIEKIIKDYLIANPELMIEVQNALEAKMEKLQAEKLKTAVAEYAKDIYRRPTAPVAGNKDGDITVTEFFDYNCGYCKKSFTDVQALIKSDAKVRVVLKELPILSQDSMDAAKIALAAKLQGKYWEVHAGLLEAKGRATGAAALKIAEKLGLDVAKLKADAEGPEVKAEIDAARELASKMGINGTPHFLVGDRSIAGAPTDLKAMLAGHIADLRKTGCTYC
jgi:protein-disulfide isomerase